MSKDFHEVASATETSHASYGSYVFGFLSSLVLTLFAYMIAQQHILPKGGLIVMIAVLAVIQLFVQLVYFLHLGRESRPRWNLIVFIFMLLVVSIVVVGSLWIMQNLNYHGMHNSVSPQDIDRFIIKDEGVR